MKRDDPKGTSSSSYFVSLLHEWPRSLTCAFTGVMNKFAAALVVPVVGLALMGVSESSAQARSLLEARRDRVVIQQWDLSCGAAALATILKYQYNEPVTEREIALEIMHRKEYLANPSIVRARQGYSLLDLQRVVEHRNYKGIGLGRLSVNDLIARAPLIVPVKLRGYNHFIVFRGIYRRQVVLADPAWGNRTMALDAFERAWVEYPGIGRTAFSVVPSDGSEPTNQLAPSAKDLLLADVTDESQDDHHDSGNPQDSSPVLLAGPALDLPVASGTGQPASTPDRSLPRELAPTIPETIIAVGGGNAPGSSSVQVNIPQTDVVATAALVAPLQGVQSSAGAPTLVKPAASTVQQVVVAATQAVDTSSEALAPVTGVVTQVAGAAQSATALMAPLQGVQSSASAPTLVKAAASTVQQVVATATQAVDTSNEALAPVKDVVTKATTSGQGATSSGKQVSATVTSAANDIAAAVPAVSTSSKDSATPKDAVRQVTATIQAVASSGSKTSDAATSAVKDGTGSAKGKQPASTKTSTDVAASRASMMIGPVASASAALSSTAALSLPRH